MQAIDRFRRLPEVLSDHVFGYLLLADIVPLLQVSKIYTKSIQDRIPWIQKRLQHEWWMTPSPRSLKQAGNQIRAHLQGGMRSRHFSLRESIEDVVVVGNRVLVLGERSSWLLDKNAKALADLTRIMYSKKYLQHYCLSPNSSHLIVSGEKLRIVDLGSGRCLRSVAFLKGSPFPIGKEGLLLARQTQDGITLTKYAWPLQPKLAITQSVVLSYTHVPRIAFPIHTDTVVLGMHHRVWIWKKNTDPTLLAKIGRLHKMCTWPNQEHIVISDTSDYGVSAKVCLWDVTTGSRLRQLDSAQYEGTIDILPLQDGRLGTYTGFRGSVQLYDPRSCDLTGKISSSWSGVSAAAGFGPYFWTSYMTPPTSSASKGHLICWDMRKNRPMREESLSYAYQLKGSLADGELVGSSARSAVILQPERITASFQKIHSTSTSSRGNPSCKRKLFP